MNNDLRVSIGIHLPDQGDGTFINPVRPNAGWPDINLHRIGDDFYVYVSAADVVPLCTILKSRDLVNWRVAGSVSRTWPKGGMRSMGWSTRMSRLGAKFRVLGHLGHDRLHMWEADHPEGPFREKAHRLHNMGWQWSPMYWQEEGRTYLFANNWIQQVDPEGLEFIGERCVVVRGVNPENPQLVKKDGVYWWFQSLMNSDAMGVSNDSLVLTNETARLCVWRSDSLLGPYEGPRTLIAGTNRWQCPNSGSCVMGPDGDWWFGYNTFDSLRYVMCRQFHLDPMVWPEGEWPTVNGGRGPGRRHRMPALLGDQPEIPDPNDEFNGPGLEGIDSGVMGSKWFFRDERPESWSLEKVPSHLSLKTSFPSIESTECANQVLQRPLGAYYTINTKLRFRPTSVFQQAGLQVKEPCTKRGVALGLQRVWSNASRYSLKVVSWFDGREAEVLGTIDGEGEPCDVWLRIELLGFNARCHYSQDGKTWHRGSQEWGWSWNYDSPWERFWLTFMPGLFAGQTRESENPGWAHFDFFHQTIHDR